MAAVYDDGIGKCFWCFAKAVTEWCGIPLCDQHWAEEQQQVGGIFG